MNATRLLPAPLLTAIALVLAACASPQRVAESDLAWHEHRAAHATLTHWELRGRIALQDGDRAESASLSWNQSGSDSVLDLQGPVGMGATRIESDGYRIRVDDGSNVRYLDEPSYADDHGEWLLPLAELAWWVRGIPAPGTPVGSQRVEQGLLRALNQSGWEIRYDEYQRSGDWILPRRVELQRDQQRARLLIRSWQIKNPSLL
jgi:outer membrane lipoprotein LolB